MDIKESSILGDSAAQHWYYRAKLAALLWHVQDLELQIILDVGAGSGFFAKELLGRTRACKAVCVDVGYACDRDAIIGGKTLLYRRACGWIDADLVLMMDVLEHVVDDVRLLSEYVQKVPLGTYFLLTVPAFSFLWGPHDVFLEHVRRYTLSEVESVATRAGLDLVHGCYFYSLLLPMAAIIRILDGALTGCKRPPRSGLRQHSPIVNTLLTQICMVDLRFLKMNRFAGLTAFCLAVKS